METYQKQEILLRAEPMKWKLSSSIWGLNHLESMFTS